MSANACGRRRRAGGVRAVALAALLAVGGARPVRAQTAGPPAPGALARAAGHLRATPRLLGDPAGLRSRLERMGISLQLYYQQLWGWKPRGGVERDGETGHSWSYDLLARVDLEDLVGAPDLVAFLQVKGQYNRSLNPTVGAFSDPTDDADFDQSVYVDQLWLEQGFADGRVRLRAGFLEVQTSFDRNAYANSEDRQFMSTALDNDPLVPLPNALGATLVVAPWPWLELAAGVADADNLPRHFGFDTLVDDADSLSGWLEATLRVRLPGPGGELPGVLRLGGFRDGRELAVFGQAPRRERGHLGWYLSLDQALWREPGGADQGLGLFARLAQADRDVSASEWFWSAGLEWTGALPGRERDVLGLGVWQLVASERLRDARPGAFHRETGVELYASFALLPWLALTPDLQYIVEPGAVPTAGDAVLVQLRVRMAF
jgi:porin